VASDGAPYSTEQPAGTGTSAHQVTATRLRNSDNRARGVAKRATDDGPERDTGEAAVMSGAHEEGERMRGLLAQDPYRAAADHPVVHCHLRVSGPAARHRRRQEHAALPQSRVFVQHAEDRPVPYVQHPQLGSVQGRLLEGVVEDGLGMAAAVDTDVHSDDEVRRLPADVSAIAYDDHGASGVRYDRQRDGAR